MSLGMKCLFRFYLWERAGQELKSKWTAQPLPLVFESFATYWFVVSGLHPLACVSLRTSLRGL